MRKYCVVTVFICLAFLELTFSNEPIGAQKELRDIYERQCVEISDIQDHIPVLHSLAKSCTSVIEIGIRGMVSSWGILQGLSEVSDPSRWYLGIDLYEPPLDSLNLAKRLSKDLGIFYQFVQANDMTIDIPICDMLFIDSLHTYCHLMYELETFSPKVLKYIAMHDTSEPWGFSEDTNYTGDYSEYPAHFDRTKVGLWAAVEDFLQRHPDWVLLERRINCHGFTVLKRKDI